MKRRLLSFAVILIITLTTAIPLYASGWITPSENGGQAEVGKVFVIEYETGVWHNTQQYCDITVKAPDGTTVVKETFKFTQIGDRIKTSFIPDQIGQYSIQEQCYYYITNQIWNGLSMSSYTIRRVDNTKTTTLDVVKELKKENTNTDTNSGNSNKTSTTNTDTTNGSSAIIKVSRSTVQKGKKTTVKITSNSGGKITVKAKSKNAKNKKYVKIKNNKITFQKKAPKGTYKFTVTSAAKGNYTKTTKTISIKVK